MCNESTTMSMLVASLELLIIIKCIDLGYTSRAAINGADFVGLSRTDIFELLPEPEHFQGRRKLLTIIEGTKNNATPVTRKADMMLPDAITLTTTFPLYRDAGLTASPVPKDVLARLVRVSIANMRAVCHHLPEPREPNKTEVAEMAKRLVREYPKLEDTIQVASGNIWSGLFKMLFRRLANVKPVRKTQGKMPSRCRKQLVIPEAKAAPALVSITCGPTTGQQASEEHNDDDSSDIQESGSYMYDAKLCSGYYTKLMEQARKKRPNAQVTSQLLRLEYGARRRFLSTLSKKPTNEKITTMVEAYPCFVKEPRHFIEEIELMVEVPPEDGNDYIKKCTERLENILRQIFLLAIREKLISPRDITDGSQIEQAIHVLPILFPATKKRNASILLNANKRSVDALVQKQEDPVILVTVENLLVVGGCRLLAKFDKDHMITALLCLMGVFYTFLLPYTQGIDTSLSFIQTHVLFDNIHVKDMTNEYKKALLAFKKFTA